MTRAWYKKNCADFIKESTDSILGKLSRNSACDGFDASVSQLETWEAEIDILKDQLSDTSFSSYELFLEFNIPRMGRRIDVLLLINSNKPHIAIIEFKVGAEHFYNADEDQVIDYALELKNFHEGSHGADIFPILVATDVLASDSSNKFFNIAADGVAEPVRIGAYQIKETIDRIVFTEGDLSPDEWEASPYRPTPTIIEAARALYSNHDVTEITRSEGSAINIRETSKTLEEIINNAESNKKKIIAFITGVPGAGKTLVGLNIANLKRNEEDYTFVSWDGDHRMSKLDPWSYHDFRGQKWQNVNS
jgi:hypothetical protein